MNPNELRVAMLEMTAVPAVWVTVPEKKTRFEEARDALFRFNAPPDLKTISPKAAVAMSEKAAAPRRSKVAARNAEEWLASDPLVPMIRFERTTSGTFSPAQFMSSRLAELVGPSMIRLLSVRE